MTVKELRKYKVSHHCMNCNSFVEFDVPFGEMAAKYLEAKKCPKCGVDNKSVQEYWQTNRQAADPLAPARITP